MKDHFRNIQSHYRKAGAAGVFEWISKQYHRKLTPQPEGTSIFDEQWDACIVLDGCRADLMEEVADSYGFLNNLSTITSVGSHSREWMENTFNRGGLDDLIIVTANPHSDEFLDEGAYRRLDEVWRYATTKSHSGTPPRPVTDRAIVQSREVANARLLVHYMQPHVPFIGAPTIGEEFVPAGDPLDNIWARLQRGEVSQETVWRRYRATLELVLDDVELLLKNMDANRVLITSDHGNGIGECGLYDHPPYVNHPAIREVPWCITSAKDTKTHSPVSYNRSVSKSVKEQMEKLGYR